MGRPGPLFDFCSRSTPVCAETHCLPPAGCLRYGVTRSVIDRNYVLGGYAVAGSILNVHAQVRSNYAVRSDLVVKTSCCRSGFRQHDGYSHVAIPLNVNTGDVVHRTVISGGTHVNYSIGVLGGSRVRRTSHRSRNFYVHDNVIAVLQKTAVPSSFAVWVSVTRP